MFFVLFLKHICRFCSLLVWLVADGWCWFIQKYCSGWLLMADLF
jgi:hypothetical protein